MKKTRASFVSHLEVLCVNAHRGCQNSFMTAPLVSGQGGLSQARLTQICLRRESQIVPIFGLVLRKRGQTACFRKLSGTLNKGSFFFFVKGRRPFKKETTYETQFHSFRIKNFSLLCLFLGILVGLPEYIRSTDYCQKSAASFHLASLL